MRLETGSVEKSDEHFRGVRSGRRRIRPVYSKGTTPSVECHFGKDETESRLVTIIGKIIACAPAIM